MNDQVLPYTKVKILLKYVDFVYPVPIKNSFESLGQNIPG